jgi:hypothetical protein
VGYQHIFYQYGTALASRAAQVRVSGDLAYGVISAKVSLFRVEEVTPLNQ